MGEKKRVACYRLEPSVEGLSELERDVDRLNGLLAEAREVMDRISGSSVTVGIDATPCKPDRRSGRCQNP